MGTHKKIVIGTLIDILLLSIYIHNVYANSEAQLLDYFVYLPIVINQEPPTPTPTPEPGVHILPNHSYYVDSINYLHVVGEVQNNTSDNLRFVRIFINIYNSNGQFIETDYTYIDLNNLPAWDRTCFDISLEEPSDWSYYQFEPPSYWTDGHPLPNLTVINDSGKYNPTYGWYEIIGQVRNDHGSRVNYVSPVSTIYNASGAVIGCNFTYVNSTNLDPGQISSFEMTFSGRDFSDVANYRLQVDGDPQ